MKYVRISLLTLLATLSLNTMAMERRGPFGQGTGSNVCLLEADEAGAAAAAQGQAELPKELAIADIHHQTSLLETEQHELTVQLQGKLSAPVQATLMMVRSSYTTVASLLENQAAIAQGTQTVAIHKLLTDYRAAAKGILQSPAAPTVEKNLQNLQALCHGLYGLIQESVSQTGKTLRQK